MSLESKIYSLLNADTTIESLVGEKIYPLIAGENETLPYIVYQVLSDVRDHDLQNICGMAIANIQVSCWANSYANVISLKDAVLDCLDNFSDYDNPSDEQIIQVIYSDGVTDLLDLDAGLDKNKSYGKRIVFKVFYNI